MASGEEVLRAADSVLVVDWPTKDVPESLARAGLHVVVHGGPGPDEYSEYRVEGDEVVADHVGRRPDHADIVYSYRPLQELADIVATAQALGARAIWQGADLADEDRAHARATVESAGLIYVDEPDIAAAARRLAP